MVRKERQAEVRQIEAQARPVRSFYRLTVENPPMLEDFLSEAALGIARSANPELGRLWDGISVWSTLNQAQNKAKVLRNKHFIAELRIEENGPIHFERTTSSAGHHTLWGDPQSLVDSVVSVVPVPQRA